MSRHFQLLSLCLLVFHITGQGQHNMAGLYETKTSKLYLYCDSTYSGTDSTKKDTIRSSGRWSVQKNKLVLQIDSIRYNKGMIMNRANSLIIKDSLLCAQKATRADYRISKRLYKRMCLPQTIPAYAEYKKMLEFNLKRTVSFQCN